MNSIQAPAEAGSVNVLRLCEAQSVLEHLACRKIKATLVHLDPYYLDKNKPLDRGVFERETLPLIHAATAIADHVVVWGWSAHLGRLVDKWPSSHVLATWLTRTYKNVPSNVPWATSAWRPGHHDFIHLARPTARTYAPKRYVSHYEVLSKDLTVEWKQSRLDVMDVYSRHGTVAGAEGSEFKGGQKPLSMMFPIVAMLTQLGDLVIDPTCGGGTTAIAAAKLGRRVITSDHSAAALAIARRRLRRYRIPYRTVP